MHANSGGSVQVDHPDGSNVLVLHALSETAHVLATVLLDGALYVLDLQSGPTPDVAVTLVKNDSAGLQAQTVTPEQVKAVRPKYDPELLIGFLRRAHDAALLRPLYPDLYQGYATRQAQYTSDSRAVKTTVTTIHRFSKDDAIVLQGTVENESAHPIQFDGRAATVQVANEVHPIKIARLPATNSRKGYSPDRCCDPRRYRWWSGESFDRERVSDHSARARWNGDSLES